MAINENIKIPLACPYYTISCLLLITSVITFVGTFAMKYEFSKIFGNYFNDYVETPVLILVAGSVLVFADACLGLISLNHRWYNGLLTFVACTTCLMVAMVILVALAYVNLDYREQAMYSRLERDMKTHENPTNAIDLVQSELKCCGYENFNDWANETSKAIPQSCCAERRLCDTDDVRKIHTIGCYQALNDFLDRRKWIVVVVLAVLGTVEVVAITLSVVVCRLLLRDITSKPSAGGNSAAIGRPPLPRVHNPLGQSSLASVDNGRNHEPYVRRPSLVPPVLNYRSPHEDFLRQPPKLRFDRRMVLARSDLNNLHAVRSPWDN